MMAAADPPRQQERRRQRKAARDPLPCRRRSALHELARGLPRVHVSRIALGRAASVAGTEGEHRGDEGIHVLIALVAISRDRAQQHPLERSR
jgi:hypothetical protein